MRAEPLLATLDGVDQIAQARVEGRREAGLPRGLGDGAVQIVHLPKLLVRFDLTGPRGRAIPGQAVFDPWTDAFEPIQLGADKPPTFDLSAALP